MNDFLLHLSALDARWLALPKLTLILVGACCLGLLIRPFHPKWRVLVWRGAWLGLVVVLLMGFLAPSTWKVTIAANVPKTTAATLSESTPMVPAELRPLVVETPTPFEPDQWRLRDIGMLMEVEGIERHVTEFLGTFERAFEIELDESKR